MVALLIEEPKTPANTFAEFTFRLDILLFVIFTVPAVLEVAVTRLFKSIPYAAAFPSTTEILFLLIVKIAPVATPLKSQTPLSLP